MDTRQTALDFQQALTAFGKNTGEYWAEDNRNFEATTPSIGQRVLRALNPTTGFGSALGSMHTAAGNGDPAGMALATAEAVPLFGALKTLAVAGKGLTKSSSKQIADWKKFTTLLGMTTGASLINDAYGNQQEKK